LRVEGAGLQTLQGPATPVLSYQKVSIFTQHQLFLVQWTNHQEINISQSRYFHPRPVKPLRGGGGEDEEESEQVMVTFSVECHQTTVGESIGIVGSCAELGNWQDIAVMNPQEWPCWSVEVQMHELYSDIEFKYVKVRKDGHVAHWERGHNRKLSLENPPAKDVFVDGGQYLIVSRHELLVETCNELAVT
jgi:hypothetical protein